MLINQDLYDDWYSDNKEILFDEFAENNKVEFDELMEEMIIDEDRTLEYWKKVFCEEEMYNEFEDYCKDQFEKRDSR